MVERRHMVNDDILQKNAVVCTSARTAVRQGMLVTLGGRAGTVQVPQKLLCDRALPLGSPVICAITFWLLRFSV